MFQPKFRRALVSAALVSALSLLPAHAAAPRSQPSQQTRPERNAVVRIATPIWDFATRLLSKVGVRIDPNGTRLAVNVDSEDNEPSSQQDHNH